MSDADLILTLSKRCDEQEVEIARLRAELDAERARRVKAESAVVGAMAERDNAQRLVQGGYTAQPGPRPSPPGATPSYDALRAELAAEREWRPMATAPTDGTLILAAVRIYAVGTKRFLYWDIQAVLPDEGLALTSCGDDCGWHWEDFEVWKPIALDGIDAALAKGGE